MAHTRDAIDTLRGYYYQFDYFILKLLTASDDDVITLEGIEDVDIQTATETTAVQCKYYAGTKYNHSVIAQPIRFMLKGFVNHSGTPLKFQLYGYYASGTDKLTLPLTLDFVKEHFLTYTSDGITHNFCVDEGINDSQIIDFINNLNIDINAISYEQQENEIHKAITNTFNIVQRGNVIQEQYYNKSLGIVRRLCIEKDVNKRKISKREFIDQLNKNVSDTFDAWYLRKKGKEQYCKLIRSKYFTSTNVSPIKRFFLIDVSETNAPSIIDVIQEIKRKYSKFGPRVVRPFCPFIYLHGVTDDNIKLVLNTLIEDGLIIKDGYVFKNSDFDAQSLASDIRQDQRVDIKFIHSIAEMNQVIALIKKSKQVFQFYTDQPYYDSVCESDIKICITEINDIKSII